MICECGCGGITTRVKKTNNAHGYKAGDYRKFIVGHSGRLRKGASHNKWIDGTHLNKGYKLIYLPDYPRSNQKGYVREHVLVVEKALGKPLPPKAVVHHVNEKRDDNRPCNLVVCEDNGYHHLLHQRANALRYGGNANWRKCTICKQYDDPKNLQISQKFGTVRHAECFYEYVRQWRNDNEAYWLEYKKDYDHKRYKERSCR